MLLAVADDQEERAVAISDVFRIADIAVTQTMNHSQSNAGQKESVLCEIYNSLFYFVHDNDFGNHPTFPIELSSLLEGYLLEHRDLIRSGRVDNNVFALTTLLTNEGLSEIQTGTQNPMFRRALDDFLKGGPYPLGTGQ
ncbi:MAG: hypothetical protein AAGH89_06150 [Verrucomicrobiota bacterium]